MCFVPERTRRATDCSRNVRVIMLETLDKTRKFLTGLDQSLAEKLKG